MAEAPDQFHRAPSGCPETNHQKLATPGALPAFELVNNSLRRQLWNCVCPQRVRVGIYRLPTWRICLGSQNLQFGEAACRVSARTFLWNSLGAETHKAETWRFNLTLQALGSTLKSQPSQLAFPLVVWRTLDNNPQALFWRQDLWRQGERAGCEEAICSFPPRNLCPYVLGLVQASAMSGTKLVV